jgi:hypothetical protein
LKCSWGVVRVLRIKVSFNNKFLTCGVGFLSGKYLTSLRLSVYTEYFLQRTEVRRYKIGRGYASESWLLQDWVGAKWLSSGDVIV